MFGIFWSNHSREFIEFCNAAFANAFTTMIKRLLETFIPICMYIYKDINIYPSTNKKLPSSFCYSMFETHYIYIYIEDDNC
jgi:hypothetical protein